MTTTPPIQSPESKTRFFAGPGEIKIAVHESGKADGRPLLFVHGFMGGSLSWSTVRRSALASEFRLISIDLRGHGDSDKPTNPTAYSSSRLWAEDLTAVMDGLDLNDVVLVAHSYGGVISMDYIRHSGIGRIGGIFFVAAAAEPPGCDTSHFHSKSLELLAPILGADLPHRVGFVQAFLRSLTSTHLPSQSFEPLLAQAMVSTPWMIAGAFSRVPESNADVLGQLTCPVAFVVGANESVTTPAMTAFVKSRIPSMKELVYPGVGHLPHIESEAAFAADLAKFARQR